VVVRHSLAILRCDVHDVTSAGDHDLVIGEVIDFEGSGGEPLIFHRGAFGGLDEDALVPRGRVIGIAGGW
jgi:flavin reductase (DIM6/NTAB) family NADH-FMN oxidoreductase RutF